MIRTLKLNADYVPMDIIPWRDAMTKMYGESDGVYCIEYYNKSIRDSMGRQYKLPSVVVLKNYVHIDHNRITFSKVNVYYRDKFTCQYCGNQLSRSDLTIDHIIPRSKWKSFGKSGTCNTFENTVTCCQGCNIKKRDRTPQEAGMVLLNQPKKITRRQAFLNKISMYDNMPDSWSSYIESANLANVQTT